MTDINSVEGKAPSFSEDNLTLFPKVAKQVRVVTYSSSEPMHFM